MRARGWQRAIADVLGMPLTTVNGWFNDNRLPQLARLAIGAIAMAEPATPSADRKWVAVREGATYSVIDISEEFGRTVAAGIPREEDARLIAASPMLFAACGTAHLIVVIRLIPKTPGGLKQSSWRLPLTGQTEETGHLIGRKRTTRLPTAQAHRAAAQGRRSPMHLTKHAITRLRHRGFQNGDAELIMAFGTQAGDGNVLRRRDVDDASAVWRRLIVRLERLQGRCVVVAGGAVVTAYPTTRRKDRTLRKIARR